MLVSSISRLIGSKAMWTHAVLQVYNERVRDLLATDGATQKPLEVHVGPSGPYIPNLSQRPVSHSSNFHRHMLISLRCWHEQRRHTGTE